MNSRMLTIATALTALLALGEFGSAVIIGLGKDPWGAGFSVVFGGLFLLATWLLRSGRITAGAIFVGVLCLFEIIEYPSWHKHGTLDWTYDSAFAVLSLAGLMGVIIVLGERRRHRAAA
jgi:hypothetical protein